MKSGMHTQSVPGRLAFTLSAGNLPRASTRVSVELVPLETGCDLILTHENVPPEQASRLETRWTGILYGLGMTLDSSRDDRDLAGGDTRRTDPLSISRPAERL